MKERVPRSKHGSVSFLVAVATSVTEGIVKIWNETTDVLYGVVPKLQSIVGSLGV
jgi:hypothetical protein